MNNATDMKKTEAWNDNFWVAIGVAFLEGLLRTAFGLPTRRY
jgi:hypothetical protein